MNSPHDTVSMLGKIANYVEILSRDPHSTVFVSLAEIYRKMGMLDDALEVARNGVEALSSFSPGHTALGRILAQRGQLEEAERAFARAVEIDPESLPALKGLARVCALGKQGERARQLLKRAAELAPDDQAVRKMLAALGPESASEERAPQPAPPSESAGTAAAGEDNEPIATATIAEIYVKQGLLDKALKVYGDLVRANPGNDRLRDRYQMLGRRVAGPAATGEPEIESSAAAPPEEPEPSPSGEALVIERLNRWLSAIRDRRDDVQ